MKDIHEMLLRAKRGTISRDEVQWAAEQLNAETGEYEPYTLLHIVGRSFATEHRRLVERYLQGPTDPMLARLALQIVCDFWGELDSHVEDIRRFLHGVPWDDEDDARQMAISCAGDYLREHDDADMLEELLRILDHDEDELLRADAYFALLRAAGAEYKDMPSVVRFNLERDADPEVVAAARRRLERLRSAG